MDHAGGPGPFVSTDAQGDWWGGEGGGTVAHAAIASFLGDTAEAMLAFARVLPVTIPRIALVDFNNDCVTDSLEVCRAMFERYRALTDAGKHAEGGPLPACTACVSILLPRCATNPSAAGRPGPGFGGQPAAGLSRAPGVRRGMGKLEIYPRNGKTARAVLG